MYKNREYFLSLYYRISDIICLNLSFFIGILLRFRNDPQFSLIENNYIVLLIFINITWLFVSSSQKIYNFQSFVGKYRYAVSVAVAIILQLFITIALNGLIKTFYSRLFLLFTYLSFSVLLFVGRRFTYLLYRKYLNNKLKRNAIVIFGKDSSLSDVRDFIERNISTETQKIIHFSDKEQVMQKLENLSDDHFISEIYVPVSFFKEEEVDEISNFCDNNFARLRIVFDWKKVTARNLIATKYNQVTIFKVALTPLDDPYNALIKRAFDLLFSLLLFVGLFSWLFPIIAILIKLSSKGPVFFVQKRSGLNNRCFKCYKFRSMRENVEADRVQACKNDPRITKLGAFLRKTSMDELPQFFNVLKGEMSVVGPRPHMLKHTEEYSELVGNFMNRHAIKPGITGLAQIKGFRGEIDDFSLLQNRIRLDRFYVNNWSLTFDIKIVFLTILTIFRDHK